MGEDSSQSEYGSTRKNKVSVDDALTSKIVRKFLPESIKEKFIKSSLAATEFTDASKPCGDIGLKLSREMKGDVIPQLEEIDFYDGSRLPKDQYVPQSGNQFTIRTRRTTHLYKILNNSRGQICFVGPAGSGKTTLLKTTTRDVINGKYENLKDMEIVHFIECKQFEKNDKITPGRLVFQNMKEELSDKEISQVLDVAEVNSSKILFVLDSLDTLPYSLDGDYKTISLHEESTPPTILSNLFAGKLIPGCRIITSSREHAIKDFVGDLRARKIIALSGLTRDSMEQIIWEYLEKTSPTLKSLCSNPVFLMNTLIGLENKLEFEPKTMSGIMVLLLRCLRTSEHAHVENIDEVINGLKSLSFDLTQAREIPFSAAELKEEKLDKKEVIDISVQAPGGVMQRLIKQNSLLFFRHQMIQETLSAVFIAEMEMDKFQSFVNEHIHKPHYCVVRRMLCGFLLDAQLRKKSKPLLAGKYLSEKRDILKKSLKAKLQRRAEMSNVERLELFISINEAQDGMSDVIESSLKKIKLYNLPLSLSDTHVIGSIISRCNNLQLVQLFQCEMYPELFASLESLIRESNVKIKDLNLAWNPMNDSAFENVAKIVERHQVESLDVQYCNLKSEHLQKFLETAKNAKLKMLDIGASFREYHATHEDMVAIIDLLPHVTEELRIVGWVLEADEGRQLKQKLDELYPTGLKVSFGDYRLVVTFISEDTGLLASAPRTTDKQCYLDWSNSSVTLMDMEKLAELVNTNSSSQNIPKVNLRNCNLDGESLHTFLNQISKYKAQQVDELDVSYNNMLKGGIGVLGAIVRLLKLKKLDLSNCSLSKDELQVFNASLAGYELNVITEDTSEQINERSLTDQTKEVASSIAATNSGYRIKNNEHPVPSQTTKIGLKRWIQSAKNSTVLIKRYEELLKKDPEVINSVITAISLQHSPSQSDLKTVARIIKSCKCLELLEFEGDELAKAELEQFYKQIESSVCQVKKLAISYCDSAEIFCIICKMVKKFAVDCLSLTSCNVSDIVLCGIKDSLKSFKESNFKELDIGHNKSLTSIGIEALAEIIADHKISKLRMSDCGLTDDLLKEISKSFAEKATTLEELNVSCSVDISAVGFKFLAEVMRKCTIKRLTLRSCYITKDKISSFNEAIGDAKIENLDVSYSTMQKDDVAAVGETLKLCEVKNANLAGCRMSEAMIRSYHSTAKHTKVKFLNLSDNRPMQYGIKAVAEIVKESGLEELDISDCMLTYSQIEVFAKNLEEATCTIQRLNLSDYERHARLKYIKSICQLLPYVVHKLYLTFWKMDDACFKELQDKLNSIPDCKLTIYLAEHKTFAPNGQLRPQ